MSSVKKPEAPKTAWHIVEPFVIGGASGMFATCCIQPMDMVKVRIQLQGEGGSKVQVNPVAIARQIIAQEGVKGLYTGLSAGLLRQATYTTSRMGIFKSMTSYLDRHNMNGFKEKAIAGLLAGGLGSIIGTPADLALIRMQADGTLPPEQRRNYTGVVNALVRIIREEGFFGMFKGCMPVVTRAMALNVGMLAFHDQALETLKHYSKNEMLNSLGAKAVAGFCGSAFSLPFDFVKTRIQKQKPLPDGTLPYKSSLHCASKVFAQEGPMAFYRGFWTYYFRIAPHIMITLFAVDALTAVSKKLTR